MTSDYCGYIIEHDRTCAMAWKGEKSNRVPDVITADLASAMQVIDAIEDYDAAHANEPDVVVTV